MTGRFRWYAVQVNSGREARVKRDIERRARSLGLTEYIRQVAIPSESKIVSDGGVKRERRQRLLPGYLLVEMVLSEDTWAAVRRAPGVLGFLGAQDRPIALSQQEVARLLGRRTQEPAQAIPQFAVGDLVRIVAGPLTDFEGEVTEVNLDQRRLKVGVRIFEREVPTELDFAHVRKSE
jgi:transcriptional antiterminator NusG